MKCLIVEDDFVARALLQKYLLDVCECHIAVRGQEAVQAFTMALDEGEPYDLICLDIMMPEMDGHQVLQAVRQREEERGIRGLEGVKVIVTTALGDSKNIMGAFSKGCESYLVKPLSKAKLFKEMDQLGLSVNMV